MATIAWVEDDIDIIDTLLFPLERKGYTINKYRTVGDAISAMDELKSADVIIVDMLLPPGSYQGKVGPYPGVDLVRLLIQREKVHNPILVLTVVTSEHVLGEVRKLAVAEIIRKPVLPSVLEQKLATILGKSQK